MSRVHADYNIIGAHLLINYNITYIIIIIIITLISKYHTVINFISIIIHYESPSRIGVGAVGLINKIIKFKKHNLEEFNNMYNNNILVYL